MARRRFRVAWAEAAIRDLEEIAGFIARDSPANAETVVRRVQERAESLERFPDRGRVVPELAGWGIRTWKEVLLPPYRILYRSERREVLIAAVLDGRRDLEDLLLERLIRGDR